MDFWKKAVTFGICLLLMMRYCACITCSSGSTSQALFTSTCQYGPTITSAIKNVKIGPVSNNIIYECGTLTGGTAPSFIRKLGIDNSNVFTNTYSTSLSCIGGFDIDYTETYIYTLLGSNPGGLIRFKTLDGSYDIAYTQISLTMSDTSAKYSLTLSSSSQMAFFSAADSSLNGYLCRWQDPNTSFDCIQYSSSPPPNSIAYASSSIVYILVLDSSMNQQFIEVDFSQSVNVQLWVSQISTGNGNTYSKSVIKYDSTTSTIYTLVNYNLLTYFALLSPTTGACIKQYLSTGGSCSYADAIYIKGDSVFLSYQCTNDLLSMYSITASTFSNYIISAGSTNIYGFVSDGSKVYIGGEISSTNTYLFSSVLFTLTSNSVILADTNTMNLYTSGADYINAGTNSPKVSSPYSGTLYSSPTITSSSCTDTATLTNVQYFVSPTTYLALSSGTFYSKTVSLTCSTLATTTISYQLIAYNGQPLPSWVTLDTANQLINFTTPSVAATTVYQLAIQSSIGTTSSVFSPVYLSVDPTTSVGSSGSSSGGSGSSSSSSGSSSSSAGSSTSKYSSDITSSQASSIVITSIAVLSAATVTTSIISGSSPQSLWSMINQFQFFMLYPMIGAYVPNNVVSFLQGVDFCLFNFNFISIPKSGYYGDFVEFFSCSSNDSYLSSIGVDSVCMVINQVKLFSTFLLLLILHFPVVVFYKKYKSTNSCCGKLTTYVFMFFTFTVYLRTIIESFLVVTLTSFNEFYVHELGSGKKILSLCISSASIIFLSAFWISTYFIGKKGADSDYKPNSTYFNEIVEGTKTNIFGRLFIFTIIARIMLSVACVIFAQSLSMITRISIFVTIQVVFILITLIVRHFDKPSDNVIQVLNDLVYLLACIALFRYNTSSNWTDSVVTILFAVISVNGLIITLIQLVVCLKGIWDYCSNKNKQNASKIFAETTVDEINIKRNLRLRPVNKSNFKTSKFGALKEEVKDITSNRFNEFRRNNYHDASDNTIVVDLH